MMHRRWVRPDRLASFIEQHEARAVPVDFEAGPDAVLVEYQAED